MTYLAGPFDPFANPPQPLAGGGYPLRLPNPQQLPFASMPTMPKKPSILDRLTARLFPSAAPGLFSPEEQAGVSRQAFGQLGQGLLAQSGWSSQPTTLGQAFGQAMGGVDLQGLTQHALALQNAQRQQKSRQHITEVAQQTRSIKDPYQRVATMLTELAGDPEAAPLVGALSNALSALKPRVEQRQRYKWETVVENGIPMRYRVNVDDPTDRVAIGPAYDPYSNPQRPFTEDQGKLADFGTRMLEAHATMTQLEQEHPGIGQAVDLKIRPLFTADKVPGLGSAIGSLITPGVLATMSPEERDYWGAEQDLVNARLRRVTGATINRQELETERMPLVPLGGEDESQVSRKQARRLQAARLYIRGAGRAFSPDFLSDEARAFWEPQGQTAPRRRQPASPSGGINPRFDPRVKP